MPTQTPADEFQFKSSGGSEPRSPSYWLQWNSCTENNQAETARANGGRAAGWILLDDLLADPGILAGELQVETCLQGVDLLQARDLQGVDHASDPAYLLAAQLIAAQLNLAVGSASCPAIDQTVQQAQLVLLALGFNGSGGYLGPPAGGQQVETARTLTARLAEYNTGGFCTP